MMLSVCVGIAAPHWSYVPLSASFSLCVKTLPILLLSATLHSAAHEVNECVRVCERERERALSLLSLLLSLLQLWQLPLPASHTHFLQLGA